jgi:hypothetical protein
MEYYAIVNKNKVDQCILIYIAIWCTQHHLQYRVLSEAICRALKSFKKGCACACMNMNDLYSKDR